MAKNVNWKKHDSIPLEASGAVQIEDNRFLVINDDDKEDNALTIIKLKNRGTKIDKGTAVSKKGKWSNLEGIVKTPKGTFYAISGKGKLYKFELKDDEVKDVDKRKIGDLLKKELDDNKENLDIEGLAWDDDHNALMIGLRSPLQGNDKAVVFFVENPDDLMDGKDGDEIKMEKVDLQERGVRGMTGTKKHRYYFIGGPSKGGPKKVFKLFEGRVEEKNKIRSVREMDFEGLEHAEGVAYFKKDGSERLLLVRDRSSKFKGDDERKGKPGQYAIIDL